MPHILAFSCIRRAQETMFWPRMGTAFCTRVYITWNVVSNFVECCKDAQSLVLHYTPTKKVGKQGHPMSYSNGKNVGCDTISASPF